MTKPDLQAIRERCEKAMQRNSKASLTAKLDDTYFYAKDIPALLAYIAKMEAVAEMAKEKISYEDGVCCNVYLAKHVDRSMYCSECSNLRLCKALAALDGEEVDHE